jgi:hypothetical protein
MADQGDFELFSGPAPKEVDEKSDEQFRDQMKQMQGALAQLQKEEGKAKANDFKLAQILIKFLSQPENTDLFLLVSRTVAQNIPSELIIAIVSLIDKKASEEVTAYLKSAEGDTPPAPNRNLAVSHQKEFHALSPEQKKEIDVWIKNINEVCFKKPHRILDSIVIKRRSTDPADVARLIREISPVMVQLSAFILRNYLLIHKVSFEIADLQDFMQAVFVQLVKDLEKFVQEQKQIK